MQKYIKIDEFIPLTREFKVFDVRSESEYIRGHIPGSYNIPLFNNEEHKKIGTVYKQNGRDKAILAGLEIVGPKMKNMVKTVQKISESKTILLHCWRGGMRSNSVSWLLSFCGFEVYVLEGGYKAFRNYVLKSFEQPRNILILGGKTGSGKTHILHEIALQGEQFIDLEKLACHKGSAFGGYNQPDTLTTEHFENELFFKLKETDPQKVLWLEDESRTIGKLSIPNPLWEIMRNSPVIFAEVSVEQRIKNILADYGEFDQQNLIDSVQKISKKLGGADTKIIIESIENGNLAKACELLLKYYDKAYMFSLNKRPQNNIKNLVLDSESHLINAINILASYKI